MTSLTNAVGAWILQNRRIVRAPIWLYRHGLGRLMGTRILMLEHVGRASGLPRYVCLEVVDRPSPDSVVVVSGFGERAQWYRNLQAQPSCHVSIGKEIRVPSRARMMSAEEAAVALARYQVANPRAWRQLRGTIEHAVGHPITSLPMVELTLG